MRSLSTFFKDTSFILYFLYFVRHHVPDSYNPSRLGFLLVGRTVDIIRFCSSIGFFCSIIRTPKFLYTSGSGWVYIYDSLGFVYYVWILDRALLYVLCNASCQKCNHPFASITQNYNYNLLHHIRQKLYSLQFTIICWYWKQGGGQKGSGVYFVI